MSSKLQIEFEKAVEWIRNAPPSSTPVTNDVRLQFYGLFKQATKGNVTGERPGLLRFRDRAKYDAWAAFHGIHPKDAAEKYIVLVNTYRK